MARAQVGNRASSPRPIGLVPLRCGGRNGERPCGRLLAYVSPTAGRVEIKCPRCYRLNLFILEK